MLSARDSAPQRPGTERALRELVLLGAAALALWVVGSVIEILLLAFMGVLLGLLLRGAARWLGKHLHLPERLCVALVCVAGCGAGALIGVLSAPAISAQATELSSAVPRALERVSTSLSEYDAGAWLVERLKGADSLLESRRRCGALAGCSRPPSGRSAAR